MKKLILASLIASTVLTGCGGSDDHHETTSKVTYAWKDVHLGFEMKSMQKYNQATGELYKGKVKDIMYPMTLDDANRLLQNTSEYGTSLVASVINVEDANKKDAKTLRSFSASENKDGYFYKSKFSDEVSPAWEDVSFELHYLKKKNEQTIIIKQRGDTLISCLFKYNPEEEKFISGNCFYEDRDYELYDYELGAITPFNKYVKPSKHEPAQEAAFEIQKVLGVQYF